MKTRFTIFFFLTSFLLSSQITLDQAYTIPNNNNTNTLFSMVKLSTSGYKYVVPQLQTNKIYLYNLNHTLFKTLNLATTQSTSIWFYDISEDLFDNNPSTVEYLLFEFNTNKVIIGNENGTVLISRDTTLLAGGMDASTHIKFTPSGLKLLLASSTNNCVYSFNLPGQLTCNDCMGGIVSRISENNENPASQGFVYPNPTDDQITIEYKLPKNVLEAELILFDLNGKVLKNYKLGSQISKIIFTKSDLNLPSGMYIYKIQNSQQIIQDGKIIIK